jgi:hypothetical protein
VPIGSKKSAIVRERSSLETNRSFGDARRSLDRSKHHHQAQGEDRDTEREEYGGK